MQSVQAPLSKLEVFGNTFKVTILPISDIENGGVNQLLAIIHHNPGVNVSQLLEILRISKRTLERRLHKLRDDKK